MGYYQWTLLSKFFDFKARVYKVRPAQEVLAVMSVISVVTIICNEFRLQNVDFAFSDIF